MIIWLASYPKSGNTWVRIFINSLIYKNGDESDINNLKIGQFPNRSHFKELTEKVDDIKNFAQNCINAQSRINLDNQIKFFKTHHAYWSYGKNKFTNEDNTLGVIYIIRDPRNVITSLKNHFKYSSYENALKFLLNEKNVIGIKNSKSEVDLPHIISSWKNHYNSWCKFNKNFLLIKYEDLIVDPLKEFIKISNHLEKLLNKKFSKEEIIKSIKNCNFDNLKLKEETSGFVESQKNINNKSIPFFYLGPKNDWRNLINNNIKVKIETAFKTEMIKLNYL